MKVLNFHALGRHIPANAVYIGRENRSYGLVGSPYANPFVLKSEKERAQVIEKYRHWLVEQLKQGAITVDQLALLKGKDLVCYCAPRPCHGDVLLQAIHWASTQA